MTDTNGPATPDQMAEQVRARIEEIDREIAQAREEKSKLNARIKDLDAEKDRWSRMLPRKPRQRRAEGEQQTLPTA